MERGGLLPPAPPFLSTRHFKPVFRTVRNRKRLLPVFEKMLQITRASAFVAALGLLTAVCAGASQPWDGKHPDQWSAKDIQRVLNDSPWARQTSATFNLAAESEPPPAPLPGAAEAGLPGHTANPPGVRWDGGVGRARGPDPTLNVLVRWESALPVREALQRAPGMHQATETVGRLDKEYVISISGLVPADRYEPVPRLETESRSDGATDARNPARMLESLMAASVLQPKDKPPIRPDDAKLDAATGTLYIFFPRTERITSDDKEVIFGTRFGALTLQKQFRLKDMKYNGGLAL